MIDGQTLQMHSIEELIQALRPVQASAFNSTQLEAALPELRLMKKNVSAILSFTSFPLVQDLAQDSEHHRIIEDVRRECLLVNGMISRIMFRQRWLFSLGKIEDACAVLTHYKVVTSATSQMCRVFAPELDKNLLSAF